MCKDYTEPSPLDVTFSSGDGTRAGDTVCATFAIINDNNLDEFTVSLVSVAPIGPVISLLFSSTTVTIQDDDDMQYVMLT